MSVRSVRLSVQSRNLETTWQNVTEFLCMLPVVMAQSSDGIVIRYVVLVLWMMSCFHNMGPMGGRP